MLRAIFKCILLLVAMATLISTRRHNGRPLPIHKDNDSKEEANLDYVEPDVGGADADAKEDYEEFPDEIDAEVDEDETQQQSPTENVPETDDDPDSHDLVTYKPEQHLLHQIVSGETSTPIGTLTRRENQTVHENKRETMLAADAQKAAKSKTHESDTQLKRRGNGTDTDSLQKATNETKMLPITKIMSKTETKTKRKTEKDTTDTVGEHPTTEGPTRLPKTHPIVNSRFLEKANKTSGNMAGKHRGSSRRTTTRLPSRLFHQLSMIDSQPNVSLKKGVGLLKSHIYFGIHGQPPIRFSMEPTRGAPWPSPKWHTRKRKVNIVDLRDLEFDMLGKSCDVLAFAFHRFRVNLFGQSSFDVNRFSEAERNFAGNNTRINKVEVTVIHECSTYPTLESRESYELVVSDGKITLNAFEVWGALRGLETLSQIMYETGSGSVFFINDTIIEDSPRFPHRGLLIDTSRHFISKDIIITTLEAMAQNKMNVLHWHIVDDQSFPFESRAFPNLSKQGAYDPVTHIYTPSDVAEVIEEARLRGIRVIPEFDTPGHTLSWGYGVKNLLTRCSGSGAGADYGPINPARDSTYQFLRTFFQEVSEVFQDNFLHLGGDEVPLSCWTESKEVTAFANEHKIGKATKLFEYYINKLLGIVSTLGNTANKTVSSIVWQEVFDHGIKLRRDTIVQVWKSSMSYINTVTKEGYKALFSSCWYLDHLDRSWMDFYSCRPDSITANELFLGGEACMWAENVDNNNYLSRIWPRASATAERLWSTMGDVDLNDVAPRLEEQRCRMLRRGISVGVASGPGYCKQNNFINPIYYRKYNISKLHIHHESAEDFNELLQRLLASERTNTIGTKEGTAPPPFILVFHLNSNLLVQLFAWVLVIFLAVKLYSCMFNSSPHTRPTPPHYLSRQMSTLGLFRRQRLIVIAITVITVWMIWSAYMVPSFMYIHNKVRLK